MSADKYPCIFSRQMEAIVYLLSIKYFFARAIGQNTSRDAAKTGEYQVIFPSFRTLQFTLARLVFIRTKLLK